jgi:hypothetical protein
VDELEEALMREEVYVGGPADEAVHVLGGFDVEMDIDAMHDLISQNAVDHLSLHFAVLVAAIVVFDSGRVPSHVAVLAAAH